MKDFIFKFKNFIFRYEAFRKYEKMISRDKMSILEIERLNWIKRKEIVTHAYNNIKFYRELYDKHGFHPRQLKEEEDWSLVPCISKEQIRESYSELINYKIDEKRRLISSTGGTSGKPLKVLHDKHNYIDVNGWRVMNWWNLNLSPNIAFVFRLKRRTSISKIINQLIWYPTKRVFLDASSVSEEKIKKFISSINRNNVIVLQGYTGALHEVAKYVILNKISLSNIKVVWCTSSPLTNSIRNILAKAFDAEIYDQYGTGEVYWIATECSSHNGLHIHSDMRHIDIIDEENRHLDKGELGNIVVTDLDNYLFPIIKYKNGDLSIISKEYCCCNKPYPLLEKIYGRVTDMIKLPNGGFIAGDYFTTIFDDYTNEVGAFQIHQKKDFSIDINVSLNCNDIDTERKLEDVKELIQNKTNYEVGLRLNVVDEIDNNLGGKSRFVISDIL